MLSFQGWDFCWQSLQQVAQGVLKRWVRKFEVLLLQSFLKRHPCRTGPVPGRSAAAVVHQFEPSMPWLEVRLGLPSHDALSA